MAACGDWLEQGTATRHATMHRRSQHSLWACMLVGALATGALGALQGRLASGKLRLRPRCLGYGFVLTCRRSDRDTSESTKKYTKSNLPSKPCEICGRPFQWRKKWEKVWDEVKYCSDKCRSKKNIKPAELLKNAAERWGHTASRREILASSSIAVASAVIATLARPRAVQAATGRTSQAEIDHVFDSPEWSEASAGDAPFNEDDFRRLDETDDAAFYSAPRFVEHIDSPAQQSLTKYYQTEFRTLARDLYGEENKHLDILDLCSSWVSHLPEEYNIKTSQVVGLGMNEAELQKNRQLSRYVVQDLNRNQQLPFPDSSFDAVLCALSIDYLTSPLQVLREASRVLRPGGLIALSFSNRLFLTKAAAIWTGKNDLQHIEIAAEYIKYSRGSFGSIGARDLSPGPNSDPMYVVKAYKLRSSSTQGALGPALLRPAPIGATDYQ